jgi:colanic acid/amylovoran biosynthesis protein
MRYLIINFYSPLNLGDLAILEQTLWLVEQVDPQAEFDVCISDDAWLPDLPSVRWVRNWNFLLKQSSDPAHLAHALRQAHLRADLILSLGGGYFFVHDHRPVPIWATLALAYALRQRKPVLCLPQSFGPFRHAYQARLVAWLMAHCNQVLLRDAESLEMFTRYAPSACRAQFVPDTAFTLGLRWPCKTNPLNDPPRIGATLVDWSPVDPRLRVVQARYEQQMADLFSHAITTLGAEVTLFVQCQSKRRDFESDLAISQRVQAQMRQTLPPELADRVRIVDDLRRPEQALVAYSRMNAFIATRLHSVIFAASQGVPTLAIGYQPKSQAAMRLLGQAEYSLEMQDISAIDLHTLFGRLWQTRGEIGPRIAQAAQDLGRATSTAIHAVIATYYRSR